MAEKVCLQPCLGLRKESVLCRQAFYVVHEDMRPEQTVLGCGPALNANVQEDLDFINDVPGAGAWRRARRTAPPSWSPRRAADRDPYAARHRPGEGAGDRPRRPARGPEHRHGRSRGAGAGEAPRRDGGRTAGSRQPARRRGTDMRTRRRFLESAIAEFIGTLILVFFGVGAVNAAVLAGVTQGLWQVAAIWAVGVALAIYATGGDQRRAHQPRDHRRPRRRGAASRSGRSRPTSSPRWPAPSAARSSSTASSTVCVVHFETAHHLVRGGPGSELAAMVFGEYFPNPAMFGTTPEAYPQVTLLTGLPGGGDRHRLPGLLRLHPHRPTATPSARATRCRSSSVSPSP